jgi:rRNA-processing protein FCF1
MTFGDQKFSVGYLLFTTLVSAYAAAITGQVVRKLEALAAEKLRNFGG